MTLVEPEAREAGADHTATESVRATWQRVLGGIRSVVLSVAALIGIVSAVVFAGAFLLGLRPVVVISGSMEPEIPVGSVALITKVDYSDVAVGDVVTVGRLRGEGLVTHRVVEKTEVDTRPALVLKGDANRTVDPKPYTPEKIYRVVGNVPGLGHVTLFLQERQGMIAVVGMFITLFAVYLLDPQKLASMRGAE